MSKIGDLCLRNFSLICATNISHNSMTDCFSALFVINVIKLMNERDSALRESKANTFRFFEEGSTSHTRPRMGGDDARSRRAKRAAATAVVAAAGLRVRCRRARARRPPRSRRGSGAIGATVGARSRRASPGRRRRPLNDREWRGAIDREGRVAEDKFASVLRRAASDGVAPDIRPGGVAAAAGRPPPREHGGGAGAAQAPPPRRVRRVARSAGRAG